MFCWETVGSVDVTVMFTTYINTAASFRGMVLPVSESDLSEELPLLTLGELWLYFLKEHVLLMEGAERSAADISASEYRTP